MASSHPAIQIARKILGSQQSKSELPNLCLQLSRALQQTPDDLLRISIPRKLEQPPSDITTAWLDGVLARASSQTPPRRLGKANDTKKPALSTANATYGETLAPTMEMLLAELRMTHNGGEPFSGDFVDVGSGRGVPSLCAAQSGHFQGISKGIEYDEDRHGSALILQKAYEEEEYEGQFSSTTNSRTVVEFICSDIQDPNSITYLDDASVVFCNTVAWDASMCATVGRLLGHAKLESPGLVVSISRRFPSPDFRLVDLLSLPCNGGQDFTFYVCQKDDLRGNGSPAISDTPAVMMLLKEERGLVDDLIDTILGEEDITTQGLALLASLGSSESVARILLSNSNLLPLLTDQLVRDPTDLARVAVTTMILRSMSDFPVGRRQMGEQAELLDALWDVVLPETQHAAIRTNVLDILGQLDYDPMGHQSLTRKDVDTLLQTILLQARSAQHGSQDLAEACLEAQAMRRWWQGDQRDMPHQE
jgi:hypothetical protein